MDAIFDSLKEAEIMNFRKQAKSDYSFEAMDELALKAERRKIMKKQFYGVANSDTPKLLSVQDKVFKFIDDAEQAARTSRGVVRVKADFINNSRRSI